MFQTSAQEGTAGRVESYLSDAFGEHLQRAPTEPAWYVPLGHIGAQVSVSPVGDGETVVDVSAWVGKGIAVSDAIARVLVERNVMLRFCALGVDHDGDIMLEASIFGDELSPEGLTRLVELVAGTAEQVDGELREQFG